MMNIKYFCGEDTTKYSKSLMIIVIPKWNQRILKKPASFMHTCPTMPAINPYQYYF